MLVDSGQWIYTDAAGHPAILDQETVDGLDVKRRQSEEDLGLATLADLQPAGCHGAFSSSTSQWYVSIYGVQMTHPSWRKLGHK